MIFDSKTDGHVANQIGQACVAYSGTRTRCSSRQNMDTVAEFGKLQYVSPESEPNRKPTVPHTTETRVDLGFYVVGSM